MEVTVIEIATIFLTHGIKLEERELTIIYETINVSQATKIRKLSILERLADEMLLTYIQEAIENGSI